ncbi:MAG: tetratricopeptide repeat protein [Polyangiaceae bacterium]|nr:tetratricopeptide repeat protein [Polyangiaceae bacterium]
MSRGAALWVVIAALAGGCAAAAPRPVARDAGDRALASGARSPAADAPPVAVGRPCGPGLARPGSAGCEPAELPPAAPPDPAPAPTEPAEPPRPGTVPGGLARGTGDEADRSLLAGDEAFAEDDLARAGRHYERARKLAPRDPAPRVGLVRVAFARTGLVTDFAAAPSDARVRRLVRDLDAILAKHADYGPAHVERGRLLLVLGDARAALQALETGVRLEPRDPEAHSAHGIALLATGDSEGALARLERASQLDPQNPARLTNLGTAYLMRGRLPEAIRAYEQAVLLAPTDPRAHGDLGTAYLAANRGKEAVRHLVRAVELAPDRATFLSNLGYAYLVSGDPERAVGIFRRALEKDPKLVSAWLNLGTALARQGKLDEAEVALRRAQALAPDDPRVQPNLDELRELREQRAPAP